MAHIKKRRRANGTIAYRVQWIDPNGVETGQTFDKYETANRFKRDIESQLDAGNYIDPAAGRQTLRSYSEQWLNNHVAREATTRRYEVVLRLHVWPALGSRQLASVRRSDVQAFVKRLSATYSPATTASYFGVLTAVYRSAVVDRLVASSPCDQVTLPRIIKADLVIPTPAQVVQATTHRLVSGIAVRGDGRTQRTRSGQISGLIWAAATTGLRGGELLGMTLESCELLRRRVVVRPDLGQWVYEPGAGSRLGPPKTPASARTVPLSDTAVSRIAEHLTRFPADPDDGYGGRIFPFSHAGVREVVGPLLVDLGFPVGSGLHLFRHFYASALIASGASPKVVQARLGHATNAETMDTYGHLWPDDDELSRTAIDAVFDGLTVVADERSASSLE